MTPFLVASVTMETLRKLERKQELAHQMAVVVETAVLSMVDGAVRTLIGPDLEKLVGRPLTERHWQEAVAKWYCMVWLNESDKIFHEIAEWQIIRKFVWKGG